MLELLTTCGAELPRALRMLIPPAWQNIEGIDPDLKAFTSTTRCTWSFDGPAGLCQPTGDMPAACSIEMDSAREVGHHRRRLHHAGLRDRHSWLSAKPGHCQGQGGPGQILVVDTQEGVLHTRHRRATESPPTL